MISILLELRVSVRTMYHYTSLTGLMGIVEQRNLWVSDIRYLNDSEELRRLGRWLNGTVRGLEQSQGRTYALTIRRTA
jgi:hypothetical protein